MDRLVQGGGEAGLAVSATVDGAVALDAWCGEAADGSPWTADTLAVVFSCTKGAAALCVQILVDRDLVDLDAPVVRYWPEFGAAGKASTEVRHLLDHTSGVVTFADYWRCVGVDSHGLADWDLIVGALADSPACWPAGSRAYYHSISYGYLVGELLRRVDGRSIGTFFAEEVAARLGLDFFIGLPVELGSRVAPTRPVRPVAESELDDATRELRRLERAAAQIANARIYAGEACSDEALPISSIFRHPAHPAPDRFHADLFNAPVIRRAEIPAANGVGSARALARMYGALACEGALDGVRLVSAASIARFNTLQSTVPGMADFGLGYHRWTLTGPGKGPSASTFGHGGAGGSAAFADPERRVSFAIVKNQMTLGPDPAAALVRTLYSCLDSSASRRYVHP